MESPKPSPLTSLFAIACAIYTIVTYAILFGERPFVEQLAGEERLIELLGGIWFLITSILCFVLFRKLRTAAAKTAGSGSTVSAWPFLLLGIFFFVACGEELSWGQHLLGFSTPASIADMNQQGELNFHNLRFWDTRDDSGARRGGLAFFLNSNRLFDYFMVSMFILLPLATRYLGVVRDLIERFRLPSMPGVFGPVVILNYLGTALILPRVGKVGAGFMNRAASEIREGNNAFICVAAAVLLYLTYSELRNPRASGESSAGTPTS